ncbi:recombinase family protein [Chamaesiphon sp. OTE_75_metabat_556]|uniref:recombinase family protein n=1 Tax=Chamaesiphon sp. OTE_75_metabat_556 TaxID=2964692 RepID=UPI00286D4BB6|nr:recombinase family protein [Chamaesiphon sp. OTE_75_metabat_556]
MQVAIYCRESNHNKDCEEQERKLRDYAKQYEYTSVSVFREVRSETKQRKKVLKLARTRQIQFVFVTDLSQWGRSASDLARTIGELHANGVSLLCLDEFNCNPQNIQGHIVLNMINLLGKFDDEHLSEQRKFEKSFGNLFSNTHWFGFKLCMNILFAVITAILLLKPETVINGLYSTMMSVVISNLLNSFDSLMVPKHKR